MKRNNTVYSQLLEAIRLFEYNLFDYKRISLILFDNIIENLLNLKVYFSVRHERIMGKIEKEKHEKILNSLNRFENITKYAKKYKIIKEKDKPILDYCHKARNNVYHKFYEDKRITECCVLILSEFLFQNVKELIDIGIFELSDELERNQEKIFEISNVKSYEEVLSKLENLFSSSVKSSEIFSLIINDQLTELIEFQESFAEEDWQKFNSIIKRQYFWDVSYKNEIKKNNQVDLEILASKFRKKWVDFNQTKFEKYKNQSLELKKLSTNDAFEKFIDLTNKIELFYVGMKYYISEQEYQADIMNE